MINDIEKKLLVRDRKNNVINNIEIVVSFSEITKSEIRKYKMKLGKNTVKQKDLWAIFGRKENVWQCVQVGSSKNTCREIKDILYYMISEPKESPKSTFFHKNVYTFCSYMDKLSVKYRTVYKKYDEFFVCKVNVEETIKGINIGGYDSLNYAEVKFAWNHKALLWNPAPPTNGNKEKEILHRYFSTDS